MLLNSANLKKLDVCIGDNGKKLATQSRDYYNKSSQSEGYVYIHVYMYMW